MYTVQHWTGQLKNILHNALYIFEFFQAGITQEISGEFAWGLAYSSVDSTDQVHKAKSNFGRRKKSLYLYTVYFTIRLTIRDAIMAKNGSFYTQCTNLVFYCLAT